LADFSRFSAGGILDFLTGRFRLRPIPFSYSAVTENTLVLAAAK
jgi:hypothetical protein